MTATAVPLSNRQHQFRQLSVLIGLNFVDMMGFAMVLPLLPFYALRLNATPEMIGWLMASFSITQLFVAPLWGRVSDHYGRRPVLLIGLTASACAFLVFGLATSLWLLFLSRIVQGAGGGTTGVAQAYVSDTVEPKHRARALGWLSAATNAGVSAGPAIGSLATGISEAAPGFFAAGLCFLNVLAAWKWLPESRQGVKTYANRKPLWYAASKVAFNPRGKAEQLVWIYGIGMFGFSLLTTILALWLGARFNVTVKTIGYFFVYYGLLSFVMRSVFLGPVVDRVGETWALRIGTLLVAVGMLLYPVVPSVWVLAFVIPLVPIGTALMFPAVTSLLSHVTDPSELGTTMGVAQTFAGIARVLAPILGTIAFQRIGIDAPFVAGGCIMLLVGWITFRYVQPPAPAASAA
ncbi:MAG TPA: MFS transporter [Gemmatimonadales bacterium]|jgi:MFS family permease|nr:MFS transporter [Gemmatimonadales bacterium]